MTTFPLRDHRFATLALSSVLWTLGACTAVDDTDQDASNTTEVAAELLECRDREPEVRGAVRNLLDEVDAGARPDIVDVDSFLGALPPPLKKNVVFLTDTRSMARIYPIDEKAKLRLSPTEEAARSHYTEDEKWCTEVDGDSHCIESRVLVASNYADFIGSFTTHKGSPASERFEMVLFDADISRLTLFDIDFSESPPVVTENPESCMGCHAAKAADGTRDVSTINWRLDPYRVWSYATPFNQDNLRQGSVELEWYQSFINRIQAGEEELRHLQLYNTAEAIASEIAANGEFRLDTEVTIGGHHSPALNIHHQLLEKNGCRATASLAQHDHFDQIKYAALGGMLDCGDVESFLPADGPHSPAAARAFFEGMGEGMAAGQFDLAAFQAEMVARSETLISDRLSRRFDHFTEFVGEEQALAEIQQSVAMDTFGVSNFETYTSAIAKTRFLLEPLGIDVSEWSMAVDPLSPSHVEFFYLFVSQPAFRQLLAQEFGVETTCQNGLNSGKSCYYQARNAGICQELATKSREALAELAPVPTLRDDYVVEDLAVLEQEAQALANATPLEELREAAADVYVINCAACHPVEYDSGAPWLPFDGDMSALEALFLRGRDAALHAMDGSSVGTDNDFVGRSQTFDYVQWDERIWDRVNRHPRQHGAMPNVGFLTFVDNQPEIFRPLTTQDKVTIRAHMLKVLGQ
jgi:hypothetical protein